MNKKIIYIKTSTTNQKLICVRDLLIILKIIPKKVFFYLKKIGK